jgi:hypothetical protein
MRVSVFTGLVLGILVLSFLAGCGGSSSTNPENQGPTAKQALEDVAAMLKAAEEERKRPPAKAADLQPYEGPFLSATLGIQQNRITYVWGAGLKPGGTAVVAYEPKAETEGGWVLLQDGTVKEVSAAEFKAAGKAGK